jgi:GMP synthase-like glutamine amidotransferase
VKILIIDNGTYHLQALKHRLAAHEISVIKYTQLNEAALETAELLILSGGHKPVISHMWYYRREIALIRSSPIPMIGICLGHELIARAYAIKPVRLKRKVHGLREVILNEPKTSVSRKKVMVYEAHKFAIKQLPVGFSSEAVSSSGIEVMSNFKLDRYSMQFHPEVIDPHNNGLDIFQSIIDKLMLKT